MSTTTFSLLIVSVLLVQAITFAVVGFSRYRSRYLALERQSVGDAVAAIPTVSPPAHGCDRPTPLAQKVESAAWTGDREFMVTRRVIEDANATVCSFYLAPVDGAPLPPYQPGQYLTFNLTIPDPVTGTATQAVRCYSLSDCPRAAFYRVSIKRVLSPTDTPDVPAGRASNYFHDQVGEGSRLSVRAPSGHFHLRDGDLPIVLIAGGIGLTPLLSMLNTLFHRADAREVWLFYGVRHGGEHLMKAHLESLRDTHPGFHLQVCYSQPAAANVAGVDYQHQGHIDLPLLQRTLHFGRYDFYVCGPPAMMAALVPALEAAGVAPENLHYEAFGPASLSRRRTADPTPGSAPVAVHFSRSGQTTPWDPAAESLLDLAEAQGIRVESGCRAGRCGSCQTRIESGEVVYRQTPEADIAPGHCLLCVATPATALTLAL